MITREQYFLTDLDAVRLRSIARQMIGLHGTGRSRAEPLFELLDSAELIPASAVRPDLVTMNSTVVCDDGCGGPRQTLTLVYPEAAQAGNGRISVLSPLGLALLGSHIGVCVQFETPGDGIRTVCVREIVYQPEAAGDWTR